MSTSSSVPLAGGLPRRPPSLASLRARGDRHPVFTCVQLQYWLAVLRLRALDDDVLAELERIGRHPCLVRAFGAPPSHCHGVSFPSGPRASRYTQMCGLRHSTFVTGPVRVTGLFPSNSAAKEWCARSGAATIRTVSRLKSVLISGTPESRRVWIGDASVLKDVEVVRLDPPGGRQLPHLAQRPLFVARGAAVGATRPQPGLARWRARAAWRCGTRGGTYAMAASLSLSEAEKKEGEKVRGGRDQFISAAGDELGGPGADSGRGPRTSTWESTPTRP